MKRIGQKGFTLIEIIVSLVLVGVMSATAGIGIVTFVKAQSFTMINAALTQKAELAVSRMTWEFMEFTDVLEIGDNYLVYHMIDDVTDSGRVLGLDTADNQIKMVEETTNHTALTTGSPLIDNVQSLSLSLWTLVEDPIGSGIFDKQLWSVGDIEKLYVIDIEMKIIHPDEDVGALTFATSVNPRNWVP